MPQGCNKCPEYLSALGWSSPEPVEFLPFYVVFSKATQVVCLTHQDTLGSNTGQPAGPQSHQQSHSPPAHPGTSHKPTTQLCDSQQWLGGHSQASSPRASSPAKQQVSETPVLDTFKTHFSLPPAQAGEEGTIQNPPHCPGNLCTPQGSLLGLVARFYHPLCTGRGTVLLCDGSISRCPSEGKTEIIFYIHMRKLHSKRVTTEEKLWCLSPM